MLGETPRPPMFIAQLFQMLNNAGGDPQTPHVYRKFSPNVK